MALGRKRSLQNSTSDSSDIDMTPMLDVVFILLIFFVVTASFVKESGLEVNHPVIADQPPENIIEKQNLVFHITANNEIFLEDRQIDLRSVRANVEKMSISNPDIKVIIAAHPKAKTNTFVLISDQAREAGIIDIALTTER